MIDKITSREQLGPARHARYNFSALKILRRVYVQECLIFSLEPDFGGPYMIGYGVEREFALLDTGADIWRKRTGPEAERRLRTKFRFGHGSLRATAASRQMFK